MKYTIECRLKGDVEKYQHQLIKKITNKFHPNKPTRLFVHFTLKSPFEGGKINEVEKIVDRFCKLHKKTPIKVGGFGSFEQEVIFTKARLSKPTKDTFQELINELKNVSWMTWNKYDKKQNQFHLTIAQLCSNKYTEILKNLTGKEKYFDCWFDNITIRKKTSRGKNANKWIVYKTYYFN